MVYSAVLASLVQQCDSAVKYAHGGVRLPANHPSYPSRSSQTPSGAPSVTEQLSHSRPILHRVACM